MNPSLFDDLPAGPDGPDRIPLERLTRGELLAEFTALSAECSAWHARKVDVAVVVWAARVSVLVEQARVYLGVRTA